MLKRERDKKKIRKGGTLRLFNGLLQHRNNKNFSQIPQKIEYVDDEMYANLSCTARKVERNCF